MLQINNLGVEVENKKILEKITLDFEIGKTYFLLGKNGSGKSSLAFALAGHPKYKIVS
jgi:Fe-S cluster assembly ATPase SufC